MINSYGKTEMVLCLDSWDIPTLAPLFGLSYSEDNNKWYSNIEDLGIVLCGEKIGTAADGVQFYVVVYNAHYASDLQVAKDLFNQIKELSPTAHIVMLPVTIQ